MPPTDAFDDADQLEPPRRDSTDAELVALFTSLVRAELAGAQPHAVVRTLAAALPADRHRLLLALADAFAADELLAWIAASPTREAGALAIAKAVAPPEPPGCDNAATFARMRSFTAWGDFAYRLLIVPGYTPLNQKQATEVLHPVARRRLELALAAHRAGDAPFLLVTGANVYPRGTPYVEAVQMKRALCAMGLDEDRVVVEPRARHTTTNLRNAGRIMRAHGIARALVVTVGGGIGGTDFFGQDFYLANPGLSTFHGRCQRELGYKVGELRGVGDGRIELDVADAVDRLSYRDPLDP